MTYVPPDGKAVRVETATWLVDVAIGSLEIQVFVVNPQVELLTQSLTVTT